MLEPAADGQDPVRMVFRHSSSSLLQVALLVIAGLVLATCSVSGFNSALQHELPNNRPVFVMFGTLGLILLIGPIANFINAEIRLVDGVVSKRGSLRTVQRWPATDFGRIVTSKRRFIESADYVAYRFLLKNSMEAFVLSQLWWRTSDIERLAGALSLPIPKPR